MPLYTFLHNFLNVLAQIANQMGLQKKNVADDERCGRPSTGTTTEIVAIVPEAILEDRRRTFRDICDIAKLSYGTCQRILSHEHNVRLIAAKFVPRVMSGDQKNHRVAFGTDRKRRQLYH
jgi:hypothetical protein